MAGQEGGGCWKPLLGPQRPDAAATLMISAFGEGAMRLPPCRYSQRRWARISSRSMGLQT